MYHQIAIIGYDKKAFNYQRGTTVKRIGLDVGGVIMKALPGQNVAAFSDKQIVAIPEVKGAIEAVKALVKKYGRENVFIISKCREVTETVILRWMESRRFFEVTGFKKENLRFCRDRSDKAPIAKEWRLTDFVDDRPNVLVHMKDVIGRLYLFTDTNKKDLDVPGLIDVASWADALPRLLSRA